MACLVSLDPAGSLGGGRVPTNHGALPGPRSRCSVGRQHAFHREARHAALSGPGVQHDLGAGVPTCPYLGQGQIASSVARYLEDPCRLEGSPCEGSLFTGGRASGLWP